VIVGTTNKDPTDPKWNDDEGIKTYRAFFEKYLPGADISKYQLSDRLPAGHPARADPETVRR